MPINHPEISPYAKLGGLVWFPRMLNKARLHAAGKLGPDYTPWVGRGFDGRCLRFLRIEYPALLARVAEGGTDNAVLEWCFEHGRRPTDEEILLFNEFMTKRGFRDTDKPGQVEDYKATYGFSGRADLVTYFDVIEADEGRVSTIHA
jgi:hypothetical protein